MGIARSPEGHAIAAERAAAAPPLTSEEARQQAQAEKLTLLVAETQSKTGYSGVHLSKPGKPKPYQAQVWCGGKNVHLGYFATAKEAALGIARSPEGQATAAGRAVAAPPLTSEEARQQAQAEGLTLRVADTKTGYSCVSLGIPGRPKPYEARVRRGGKKVSLGSFATAEEAALCFARSPEGQVAAAERAAVTPPLTSEEARQQAQAEGLTLLRAAESKSGYFGVGHLPGRSKPFEAKVSRGAATKQVRLGSFATAEEAALCVARSPEGQAAAGRAAAAESQGTLPAVPSGAIPREKGTAMAPGAEPVVKVEDLLQLLDDDLEAAALPSGAILKEEGTAPPLPPGTFVTEEQEVVVKEEEGSDCLPKRQRMK
eukprot:scaffold9187_cov50-Phaeocystis_antarctica.AAC.2